jgi:PAP2 superfamily
MTTNQIFFPDEDWDPELKALSVLTSNAAINLLPDIGCAPPEENIRGELANLRWMQQNLRMEMKNLIYFEKYTFRTSFERLLNPHYKKNAVDGFSIFFNQILPLADVFIMREKAKWSRARPYHHDPSLLSPFILEKVRHPSYPSGHATQARFISLALMDISWLTLYTKEEINALAYGIAIRREIGGVHFASDSVAGWEFGEKIYDEIKQTALYLDHLNAAQALCNPTSCLKL